MADQHQHPRVVIIGAGFGGLYAARTLAKKPVSVLLIDRNNFHTFTPLLYQVATCALDPSEIAYPIRSVFRKNENIDFLMGDVRNIDAKEQHVVVETNNGERQENYDYLIIAAGSVTNFFGLNPQNPLIFELKTLQDAINLRNHVLSLFEKAAWATDKELQQALTTLIVVGGGPTGLETAGALHELYNHVLDKEYRQLKDIKAQVYLIEATDHLLDPYPEKLQRAALNQLESLGVKVIFNNPVVGATDNCIRLKDGREIATYTLLWMAGVQAPGIAAEVNQSDQHIGRIEIQPTMEVVGLERVYAVGDNAFLDNKQGKPYPMMIPVAKQQGILAARNILRRESGKPQQDFRYRDRGIMATIGRRRAVAWVYNRIPLTGYFAWIAWLALHIITLMGFRNRLNVLVNWMWNYITYDRSVRIITE